MGSNKAGKGAQMHLLLRPTDGLQVIDQRLLALLQRLLQVLEGSADLRQGLCLALLQLLADAPHQGDRRGQLWQPGEGNNSYCGGLRRPYQTIPSPYC